MTSRYGRYDSTFSGTLVLFYDSVCIQRKRKRKRKLRDSNPRKDNMYDSTLLQLQLHLFGPAKRSERALLLHPLYSLFCLAFLVQPKGPLTLTHSHTHTHTLSLSLSLSLTHSPSNSTKTFHRSRSHRPAKPSHIPYHGPSALLQPAWREQQLSSASPSPWPLQPLEHRTRTAGMASRH